MDPRFIEIVQGRRCVVIGNAACVDHALVRSADVTLRCNRTDEYCDVLFWDAMVITPKIMHDHWVNENRFPDRKPQFIYMYAWRPDDVEIIPWCNEHNVGCDHYATRIKGIYAPMSDMFLAARLEEDLGCRPFTGFIAALYAKQGGAAEVFMTGADMYNYRATRTEQIGPHVIKSHLSWLKAQNWLTCDDVLSQLVRDFGD